jgi:hypothetical protein
MECRLKCKFRTKLSRPSRRHRLPVPRLKATRSSLRDPNRITNLQTDTAVISFDAKPLAPSTFPCKYLQWGCAETASASDSQMNQALATKVNMLTRV